MPTFRSNGKILLTGEYTVLDGARALALPTIPGQSINIEETEGSQWIWKSYNESETLWFEAQFDPSKNFHFSLPNNTFPEAEETAKRLQQIFLAAREMLADQMVLNKGHEIKTFLEFNRKWGLGTSSTLINNLAQWLEIDAYQLLEKSFGGSGYDIAAASHDNPITYQKSDHGPMVLNAEFDPPFKNELFFVYLNRKQNSREAIAHYKQQSKEDLDSLLEKISGITEQIIHSQHLVEFEAFMQAHENLISKAVNLEKIKNQLFPDYPKCIKSLGGWGGDFILATGGENHKDYFRNKGYHTILDYQDLIK